MIENSPKDFQKLKKKLTEDALVVMQATGYYHYRLAQFLSKEKLLEMVKKEDQKSLTLLKSIPKMGVKTAMFLLVATEGFSKFETASQRCSFVGITPTIRTSGGSVRGRGRMSKIGKKRALIAVCNKLLKQAFASVKNGSSYDENFVSTLN